jgi:hypothetical protein
MNLIQIMLAKGRHCVPATFLQKLFPGRLSCRAINHQLWTIN